MCEACNEAWYTDTFGTPETRHMQEYVNTLLSIATVYKAWHSREGTWGPAPYRVWEALMTQAFQQS